MVRVASDAGGAGGAGFMNWSCTHHPHNLSCGWNVLWHQIFNVHAVWTCFKVCEVDPECVITELL